ncbi:universal stress protein A-like protein isoform X2 [Aristolochia californica]|uniref:universal stress protein A-like protein isoform X2 n=1 Tax=Aristolochia californica TaxID=171875 RepID=UPI0035E19CBD
MESGEKGRAKKVMVAVDESDCSHYALEWMLNNLRECCSPSSPLILFNVQSIVDLGLLAAASHGGAQLIQSVSEQQKKFSMALLEKAKAMCDKEGVAANMISEVGDPKDAICGAVERLNVNLLILGSRGRGLLKRTFLGSVSNYCVHNAPCSVLVVKKKT